MWVWTIVALGAAGILDLAAGLFLVHILSDYFSYPLAWWQYVIGAFLGASPDIDLCYASFRKNQTGHHEYLTHRPIIGIPLAFALGWLLGGTFWAIAACIGVCWHYVHDTQGFLCLYDNGLAWFWPFSKKYWGVQYGRIVGWTFIEHLRQEGVEFEHIYEAYLTPTRKSITEFTLAGILFWYVLGLVAAFIFCWGVVVVWTEYRLRVLRT